MTKVNFNKESYLIDGKPDYLNSGEFHYFRVPKKDWVRRMKLFKEAGGNCLATYVPWLLHEPKEGQFVFSGGEGKLDLEDFLKTAQDEGLFVIARPGPYQYSELRYGGLARWMCQEHPEIMARNHKGQIFRSGSVCYLHPYFLERTKIWFDHVLSILEKYTVTNNGPICFTQFDNELAGIHVWFGSLDYHPEFTQAGKEDGRYPAFLKSKYNSIKSLNTAYGTNYKTFAQIVPPDPDGPGSFEAILERKDYFEFYRRALAEYAGILVGWFRQAGLDVPVVHNAAAPAMNRYFVETKKKLGDDVLIGSDHYYNLGQEWKQNNPTGQLAVRQFCSLETLRLMGCPPTIFELPGGSNAEWPPIGPVDAKACYFSNLALGMKGHNYYIFTGGTNPPDAGVNGDLYDYNAGISADGQIRPLYQSQKEFGLFIKNNSWLADAVRLCDCRFTLDMDYQCAGEFWKGTGGVDLNNSVAWDFTRAGMLTSAFCGSYSPNFCNLSLDDWIGDTDTPVVVVTSSCMAAEKQQRIVDYLQAGGQVLISPVLPEFDEDLKKCTILKDYLGAEVVKFDRRIKDELRITVGDVKNVYCNGEIFFTEKLPQGAQVIGKDERTGKTVCWAKRTKNDGKAIFLGFRWAHSKHEHWRMFAYLMAQLGGNRLVSCSNPNVWTSIRRSGDKAILFLMNLNVSPMEVEVSVEITNGKRIDLGSHKLDGITVLPIPITA